MKFLELIAFLFVGVFLFTNVTNADDVTEDGRPICVCPRVLHPVCAENQVTYVNECEFDCVRTHEERQGRSLALLREGRCEDN
ncbi:ovomucoid-like [Ceratitis capitata]|uniref:ovomucoid-like n=1 Tax=Ceratitis capitata TaxID=7213 RepID=UPI0006188E2D|nr:ovomucoid-like [Ceratitis capitata]